MNKICEYSSYDAYLFHEGTHTELYKKLGAHPSRVQSTDGILFRIWAPNAKDVRLLSDCNGWDSSKGIMKKNEDGVWECFMPEAGDGDRYRYQITGCDGIVRYKSDPYACYSELRPNNASIVYSDEKYQWNDQMWQNSQNNKEPKPISIYELSPGSWKKTANGFINYKELGEQLAEYIRWTGFTHVELMGICEFPFDGSWGYQVSGYYSPTSRYGTPNDLKAMIDILHQNGIGVLMDWVPAHFVKDDFALERLDGSCLYEPKDERIREYPEWGTYAFDFSKPEVRSFLISNACYWIREFHMDGLRVDAVAAMLYLDYCRSEWTPNQFGDNRYLAGRDFLKQFNDCVHTQTNAITIAEDSSIESGITKPVKEGGYGFDYKWNMGWMNDTLKYMEKDPIYRKYHHGELTHAADYAFTERFILVLSHDEVVHLKKSMLGKMPGSIADRLGNLKALYTLQYMQPGKKLLFMGQEFATEAEWREDIQIPWELAEDPGHREILLTVRNLNFIYQKYPVLWNWEDRPESYRWIEKNDTDRNTISFVRKNPESFDGMLIVAINFSRTHYSDFRIGVPIQGSYKRIFSTYDTTEGGGGPMETGVNPTLFTKEEPYGEFSCSITYGLRPNEAVILEYIKE